MADVPQFVNAEAVDQKGVGLDKFYHACGAGQEHLVECKYHNKIWMDEYFEGIGDTAEEQAVKAALFMINLSPYAPGQPNQSYEGLMKEMFHNSKNYCGGKDYIIQATVYSYCPNRPADYKNPYNYETIDSGATCFLKGRTIGNINNRNQRQGVPPAAQQPQPQQQDLQFIGADEARRVIAQRIGADEQLLRSFEIAAEEKKQQQQQERPVQVAPPVVRPQVVQPVRQQRPVVAAAVVAPRSAPRSVRRSERISKKVKPLQKSIFGTTGSMIVVVQPQTTQQQPQHLVSDQKLSIDKQPEKQSEQIETHVENVEDNGNIVTSHKSITPLSEEEMLKEWAKLITYFQAKCQVLRDELTHEYKLWTTTHELLATSEYSNILKDALNCISVHEALWHADAENRRKLLFYKDDQTSLNDLTGLAFAEQIQTIRQDLENKWLVALQNCVQTARKQMQLQLVNQLMLTGQPLRVEQPPTSSTERQIISAQIDYLDPPPSKSTPMATTTTTKSDLEERVFAEARSNLHVINDPVRVKEAMLPASPADIDAVVNRAWKLFEASYTAAQKRVSDQLHTLVDNLSSTLPAYVSIVYKDALPLLVDQFNATLKTEPKCAAFFSNNDYRHYITATYATQRAVLETYANKFLQEHVDQCVDEIVKTLMSEQNLQRLQQQLAALQTAWVNVRVRLESLMPADVTPELKSKLITKVRGLWIAAAVPLFNQYSLSELPNALANLPVDEILLNKQDKEEDENDLRLEVRV